ncbi:MAG: holo-ACP synthase [Cyanobacteria bacterium P01_D01_bin.44]
MDSILRVEAGYLEVNNNIPQNLLNSKLDSLEVIGHGIDITETRGIKELIERFGESLEMRCFTVDERGTYESGAKRIEYFAGRLAAKEAVLKALGKKRSENASWLDIEIRRLPTGRPSVVLYGKCQQIAVGLGITKWLVSISHESSYAAASVIALGRYDKQSSLFSLR